MFYKTGVFQQLLTMLLALSFIFPLAAAEKEPSEAQLNILKQRIDKLESWLGSAKGKQSQIQGELRKSEKSIGLAAQKLAALTKELKTTQAKVSDLRQQRSTLAIERKKQAAQIAEQIRAAYRIGQSEYLKILLNLEQPAELARTLRYYDYFNQARAEEIERYQNTAKQLQKTETLINEQLIKLQAARQQLSAEQQNLKNTQADRQAILVRLQRDIGNKDQQLTNLLADRKQLEELLASVGEAIADLDLPSATTPINTQKGKLPWPTSGKIVRSFGSMDQSSGTRWNGVLIRAEEGSEVRAIHYGRVVFSDWLRGFGLLLIIDHGNGYLSLYGHNQSVYRETGDWVNANEIISSVGKSGGYNQAGLYFEIRRNGKPQNPKSWMLARN